MYDFNASQSVLDSYDANSPGDCSKPLGAACVHALTQHPLKDYESRGLHLGVPECADVLGTLRDQVENYEGDDVVSQVSKLSLFELCGISALLTSHKIPCTRTLPMGRSSGELLQLSVATAGTLLMKS
jgi:hypothetical protein